jgi:hypothetical protein
MSARSPKFLRFCIWHASLNFIGDWQRENGMPERKLMRPFTLYHRQIDKAKRFNAASGGPGGHLYAGAVPTPEIVVAEMTRLKEKMTAVIFRPGPRHSAKRLAALATGILQLRPVAKGSLYVIGNSPELEKVGCVRLHSNLARAGKVLVEALKPGIKFCREKARPMQMAACSKK